MSSNQRDENSVPNIAGVSSITYDGSVEPAVNPSTHALLTEDNAIIDGSQLTKITDGAGVVNTKQIGTNVTASDVGLVVQSLIHGLSTAGGGTYVDVKVNPSGSLQVGGTVAVSPLTTIYNGSKTVPTVTAETIASSQSISSVTIKALSTNTVAVYIGTTGVTTSTGFELLAGESISLDVDNLTDVYCISGSASQVVRYIAV